jgi:hypothetical protein
MEMILATTLKQERVNVQLESRKGCKNNN